MPFQPKTVLSTDQELLDYFISFLKELRYELPTFFKDCDVFLDNDGYGDTHINAVLFKVYGIADPGSVLWYFNNIGSNMKLWRPDNSHAILGGIEKDVWRVEPLIRLMVAAGLLHSKDGERLTGLLNAANHEKRAEETVIYSIETLSQFTRVPVEDLKAFIEQRKSNHV